MTLEQITGKNYVSHSALNTWLSCGWQFYLSRIQRVPEQPSFWLAGGKAVHEATELYDRLYYGTDKESTFSSHNAFVEAWNRNFKDADNGMEWRAGGRATKANPNKEDAQWWLDAGPKMVDFWTQFRNDSGFTMYKLPDGTDAIETELNQSVGGVPIKAFLDRLMVAPTGELLVVDIKTSSREPASLTQLGIYAILVEKTFGVRPTHGSYYMARSGELTPPESLDRYTENRLGSWAKGFELAIENQIFIPSPSSMCGTCSVNKACYSYGGEDSHLYPEITIGENE
jgi:CRISPR/Cas system-associated exonuclease Cas4 (RecB family)